MRQSSKALIALGIGNVANVLVILGIYSAPCTPTPATQTTSNQTSISRKPAFESLTDCTQARTAGFVILGAGDTFSVVMVATELRKHGR